MLKTKPYLFRIGDNDSLVLLAVGITVLHVITNGGYGFHRDELDILMNARQLDWGYVAYPPLTPFIARLGLIIFGDSLRGLRLFSAIGQGIVVILGGLMARDLGGKRPAQIMAGLAVVIAPAALVAGTMIQYMSFDYLWWVLLAFLTVRLLATEDPRWWLGIGTAIGLGMMTKYTMIFFVAGLVLAVLLTPARRYLLSPWLWAGAGLALLIYSPNLIWQVRHGFVSLDFLRAIHDRDIAWGRTEGFLTDQLYVTTNPFTLPLWIAGLVYIFFLPSGRRFRALGWMYLAAFVLLYLTRGRGYYLAPAYAMLLAAGAAWLEGWLDARKPVFQRIGRGLSWGIVALGTIVGVVLMKPIAPVNSGLWEITSGVNGELVEMIGWPDLVEQVAQIYANLPGDDKPGTVILAGNYGEAGALDLYGEAYGLPPVISGANSLWARGYGNPDPETVILVGFESQIANRIFRSCEWAGRVTNRYDVKNEETTSHTGLYVCREPREPWAVMWMKMQWFQ